MIERITVDKFVDYFRYQKDIYYFIRNFEHIEYEVNKVVAPDISENLNNYQRS